MSKLKGPLTPTLARQGPQGVVSRPTDRLPSDHSINRRQHGSPTGFPAPTPRPKGK